MLSIHPDEPRRINKLFGWTDYKLDGEYFGVLVVAKTNYCLI